MHKLVPPQAPDVFAKGVAAFILNGGSRLAPNRRWEAFRNEQPEAYKAARDQLYGNQAGLCAYCEIKLATNNQQIEHIIPKSMSLPDRDYTFEFSNFLLCCRGGTNTSSPRPDEYSTDPSLAVNRSCGEKKGAYFGSDFISPCHLPAIPVFELHYHPDDGVSFKVDPEVCAQHAIDPEKIEKTMDILGLNCPRLKRNRKVVWNMIQAELNTLPNREDEYAIMELAEAHLVPVNGECPPYVTTRFLYLMSFLSVPQLLGIVKW